jgi:hypothetical protein
MLFSTSVGGEWLKKHLKSRPSVLFFQAFNFSSIALPRRPFGHSSIGGFAGIPIGFAIATADGLVNHRAHSVFFDPGTVDAALGVFEFFVAGKRE